MQRLSKENIHTFGRSNGLQMPCIICWKRKTSKVNKTEVIVSCLCPQQTPKLETMVPSFFSSTPRLFNRQGTFSLNMKDRFHQRALYMKGKLLICIPKVGGAFLLHGCLRWLKNLLENGWGRLLYSQKLGDMMEVDK